MFFCQKSQKFDDLPGIPIPGFWPKKCDFLQKNISEDSPLFQNSQKWPFWTLFWPLRGTPKNGPFLAIFRGSKSLGPLLLKIAILAKSPIFGPKMVKKWKKRSPKITFWGGFFLGWSKNGPLFSQNRKNRHFRHFSHAMNVTLFLKKKCKKNAKKTRFFYVFFATFWDPFFHLFPIFHVFARNWRKDKSLILGTSKKGSKKG